MLANIRVASQSSLRLGCQLRPTGDVSFAPMLPPHAGVSFAYGGRRRLRAGDRRYVACLFVEMRDIAASEGASPREVVFLVNRFLSTVAQSISDAGGQPNRIYGAGVLALFGLQRDPVMACRQAIEAAALLSANVDHLNELLERDARIQFVVGLHAGEVVLGEVGLRDELAFTAVGGAVRDAAALLDQARLMNYEVLLSEHVCAQAGVRRGVLEEVVVALPGGERTMAARAARRAVAIFGALDAIVDDATRQPEPPGAAELAPV